MLAHSGIKKSRIEHTSHWVSREKKPSDILTILTVQSILSGVGIKSSNMDDILEGSLVDVENRISMIKTRLDQNDMLVQDKKNIFDIVWSNTGDTYGDIFLENEIQQSYYNFDFANTDTYANAASKADAGFSHALVKSVCDSARISLEWKLGIACFFEDCISYCESRICFLFM